MSESERRRKRLVTALVVALAVAFFACGGAGQRGGGSPPAVASLQQGGPAPAGPARPAADSSPSPVEVPTDAEPAVPAESDSGTTEASFGSLPDPLEEPVDETATPAAGARPQAAPGGSKVFTNADLARYKDLKADFGMRDGDVIVDTTRGGGRPGGPDAKPADEPGKLTPAEIERETAETQRRIEGLTAETEALRRRIPSLHNPLLPRVAPTEADGLAEAGMDNAERLARVTQQISANDQQLDQLRRRLAELHDLARAAAAERGSLAPPQAP